MNLSVLVYSFPVPLPRIDHCSYYALRNASCRSSAEIMWQMVVNKITAVINLFILLNLVRKTGNLLKFRKPHLPKTDDAKLKLII